MAQHRGSSWIHPTLLSAIAYYVLEWLSNGGPQHPKHRGWHHPFVVSLVHYTLVFLSVIPAHDWMVAQYYHSDHPEPSCQVEEALQNQRTLAAMWFFTYAFALIICRLFFKEPLPGQKKKPVVWAVLYDYCWICNVTLSMGGWALYSGRPILHLKCTFLVFLQAGKAVSSAHYLWTIPLLLCVSRTGALHILSFPLSLVYGTVDVVLSRLMKPLYIDHPFAVPKYLNINMSHEMWKDVKFGFMHRVAVMFQMIVLIGDAFNSIIFPVLYALSYLVSAGSESRIC